MTTRPATVIDPVCGMTVSVAEADADGRTAEYEGRTYAFCRHGCRRAFLEEPGEFASRATAAAARAGTGHDGANEPADGHGHGHEHAAEDGTVSVKAATAATTQTLVIDAGMRRWYESCSCCLSDAYPEIKAALDAERAAAKVPPVDPGICEVAEAAAGAVPAQVAALR